jgi:hypothetical protein
MQSRRKFLVQFSAVAASFFGLTGFTHNKLIGGGGGGGGSWKVIITDWRDGLALLVKAFVVLGNAQADIADALDLKKDAAKMRAQAKKIEETGDSLGGSDIEEFGQNSESTQKAINEKLKKTGKLDAKQKLALAKAGGQVVKALGSTASGVIKLVSASSKASSAPTPGIADLDAVKIAPQIPALMPKAAGVVPKLFEVANDFQKVAAEKDIAVPAIPAAPTFG